MNRENGVSLVVILIIIAIIVGLGVSGALIYTRQHRDSAGEQELKEISEIIEGIDEIAIDDWKLYKNKGMGFEFYIPADWNCEEFHGSGHMIRCGRQELHLDEEYSYLLAIEIDINIDNLSSRDLAQNLIYETENSYPDEDSSLITSPEYQAFKMADLPATRVSRGLVFAHEGEILGSYDIVFLADNYNNYYAFRYPSAEEQLLFADSIENNKIVNRVLSTFRFFDIDERCRYRKGKYELRAYDSQGRVTGMVNGEKKFEIPDSFYFDEMLYQPQQVMLFGLEESYAYEVFGIKEGNYNFGLRYTTEKGREVVFSAVNIPLLLGVSHRYVINWEKLERGENGVIIQFDLDGDAEFEKEISSDQEFTCEEFFSQTN